MPTDAEMEFNTDIDAELVLSAIWPGCRNPVLDDAACIYYILCDLSNEMSIMDDVEVFLRRLFYIGESGR
uniref:Uncharacterized protein n=1 Tax=Rhabditophanes sp. KR3021 TaxID=114890 RepID=A0AC35U421_9BILA